MRAQMWSRALVVLCFFSLSVQASPPAAQEPGTRVTLQLAVASGQLPDAEKLVESLVAAGGQHQIQVRRQQTADQQALTLELWGATVPPADIPQTLREAFPVLASAGIEVASIDPEDRPKLERDCDRREAHDGKCIVKKVVKVIRKE